MTAEELADLWMRSLVVTFVRRHRLLLLLLLLLRDGGDHKEGEGARFCCQVQAGAACEPPLPSALPPMTRRAVHSLLLQVRNPFQRALSAYRCVRRCT